MERAHLLTVSAIFVAGLSGCVMDLNSQSRITINATEASCDQDGADVDFDTRNSSEEVERRLNEIVSSGSYTERPEYSSATDKIYDTLRSGFNGTDRSGTVIYNGSCYRVEISRIFDD